MRGTSSADKNNGTDFALSFVGEAAIEENSDGGGLALAVEKGLPGVADRFLADRRPGSKFESEKVRECVCRCPGRLWSRTAVLKFSISLWLSVGSESRLTRLRALASGGAMYSSCGGGDAERLEL